VAFQYAIPAPARGGRGAVYCPQLGAVFVADVVLLVGHVFALFVYRGQSHCGTGLVFIPCGVADFGVFWLFCWHGAVAQSTTL